MKTKNTFRRFLLFILAPLVSVMLFTACSDDEPTPITQPEDPNIVEVAQGNDNFSILVDLVVEAGLADDLASGELTVFAPTNDAFEALFEVVDPASLTQEDLIEILTYHVTSGAIPSSALSARQDVEMLNGEITLVQASAAGVNVNGTSTVVQADIEASNGVIHAVDEVLLPTEFRVAVNGPSLIDVAREAGNFETLLSLAEQTGFTSTLTFLGPYTTFAPTDEAFDTLFESVDPAGLETEQIAFILTYHVLIGEPIFAGDLAPEQTVGAANEEFVYITAADEVSVNNSATVTTADVEASNGVIHIIDEVLLPNPFVPVTGVVAKNYDLSTLLGLVAQRPAILEALSDPDGEFTVFAPTNAAFEAALAANPGLTEEQITEILTYHVLTFQALAGDLDASQTVETLQGEDLLIEFDGESVTLNGSSTVEVADQVGSNGAVHIIDEVILPASFGGGPPSGADAEITINNVGSTAWIFEAIEGSGAGATLNEENTPLTLDGGGRYTIINLGAAGHPFQLRDSNGNVLIAATGDGSLQDDTDANVVLDEQEGSITFTLSGALADNVATYNCQPHAAMEGVINVN